MGISRITFAGKEFSAHDRGDGTYSVPVNGFKQLLLLNVVATCNYDHTDDNRVTMKDFPVPVSDLQEALTLGKPTVLYYDREENHIRFCPHRQLSYTLRD